MPAVYKSIIEEINEWIEFKDTKRWCNYGQTRWSSKEQFIDKIFFKFFSTVNIPTPSYVITMTDKIIFIFFYITAENNTDDVIIQLTKMNKLTKFLLHNIGMLC